MDHIIKTTWLRRTLKGIMWVLIVLLLIPALLYVPFIQNRVKDIALKEVSKSLGWQIELDYFRLRFPLVVDLEGLRVIEAPGDTMINAGKGHVDVSFIPLLHLDIKGNVTLEDVRYQLGTPDSAMYLVAKIHDFRLDPSSYNLRTQNIDISRAVLDGGDVTLLFNENDTTAVPVDTASSPTEMFIKADDILLRNVSYRMSMLPVIDSLGAFVEEAHLQKGEIDMAKKLIHAESLSVDSVTATYLTPSLAYLESHPAKSDSVTVASSSSSDEMWVITGDKVSLTGKSATYAVKDAVPQPGLDMNYLSATDIVIKVDSFYNKGVNIKVPLRELRGTERCGVKLSLKGLFEMDTVAMRAEEMELSTVFSDIKLYALMGMGDMTRDASLPLELDANANIGIPDLEMLFPAMGNIWTSMPRRQDIELSAQADGTVGSLKVTKVGAAIPGYVNIGLSGEVSDMMNPDRMDCDLTLMGNIRNVNFIKPSLLEAKLAEQINIPPTMLTGDMKMRDGVFAGNLKAITGGGDVLLDGMWNGKVESYSADVSFDSFPVEAFLPHMGIGNVTADINAKGRGFDFTSPKTHLDAKMSIDALEYEKKVYSNLRAWASLDTGTIDAGLISVNHDANFDLGVSGRLLDGGYDLSYEGDVHNLDLKGLNLSTTACAGSLSLSGSGFVNPAKGIYDATLDVTNLDWMLGETHIDADTISAAIDANDSIMRVTVDNNTLHSVLLADCPLDTFTARLSNTMVVLDKMMARNRIAVDTLQQALPRFIFNLNATPGSVIDDFLSDSKTSFRAIDLAFDNDSLINVHAKVNGLKVGDTRTDSITFSALQHGKFLVYSASMNNRPGTFDEFAHVALSGYLANENLALFLNQSNIKNETGFRFGINFTGMDSVLTMRLAPLNPVIGYKTWSLNPDNVVKYDFADSHLDANLELSSGDSHLKIFTVHNENEPHTQEEIVVDVTGIQLADWLALSPFAPPVKGTLGADVRMNWDSDTKTISGHGEVGISDLYYGPSRVGTFDLGLQLTTTRGVVHAETSLEVDSQKVLVASGTLNDSTARSPFLLDLALTGFPLKVVNPFLPEGMASLQGRLNGEMDVTGSMSAPRLDGYLAFDSAAVLVNIAGTRFTFPDTHIPVDSSIVKFNEYSIHALNENPLIINGTVDVNSFISPSMNLSLWATNMQIVGTNKGRGKEIYGKAFIDADAKVVGNMDFMRINADLNLLEGSNVTYVMSMVDNNITDLSSSDNNLVRFVQFNDTTTINEVDTVATTGLAMMLEAHLTVSQGSTINVDLSANGQDKVQIQGNGNLNFTMSPFSNMRLTGRFNIDDGFVRYTPPLMSQKLFRFVDNSYIAFNGDMMNPILNIHGEDTMKANVTEEGQNSRLINFIVSLSVTNTLENMNVAFDLSTNDDLTVENELQTMSPEQRANQAMNLLLYNVYTGPGTKASASLSGNPLFAFLTSQINTWAANTIKGVDISFGIDQYDRTYQGSSSTATSYSYRVSKTLFNDRIKIVVGGNYTADSEHDENFSESIINDISFEYMLNRSGSMYLRLFRHVGYESILEGEVIQTGVGFVYKRKLRSLRDLFRFGRTPREARLPENSNIVTEKDNEAK